MSSADDALAISFPVRISADTDHNSVLAIIPIGHRYTDIITRICAVAQYAVLEANAKVNIG